ncbi:MAG: hypothetical protein ACLTR8_11455 [Oscillospiraceae bacterium]
MEISHFFMNGDIKGAIAYMREHEEFKDILPAYVAIFENGEYRRFDVPDKLNEILRLYQIYYRDTFYCGLPEAEAAEKLLAGLKALLNMPDAEEALLTERLHAVFEAEGYHALFGKTQGYYGPYIWRETVPTVYQVGLPGGTAEYTVNILKGFVFRSWMDYLTFGRFGTGGWASPDGTINCIEQAYDFESERFLVSLLKHEAQHTVDMKQFPGITPKSWNTGQNWWSFTIPAIWGCCKSSCRKRMKAEPATATQWHPQESNVSLRIRIRGRCPAFRRGRWNCFMLTRTKWKKNMESKKPCPTADYGKSRFIE